MKLGLTAALFFVILIIQGSLCARLKSHSKSRLAFPKKDKVLRSVLRKLINQNNLKGFFVHNMIRREKNPEVKAKSKELLREISAVATVAHYSRSAQPRFLDKKFMRNYRAQLVHFNLAATSNVYFIFIINSYQSANCRLFWQEVAYLNWHFSIYQSVTKTLIISILEKPYTIFSTYLFCKEIQLFILQYRYFGDHDLPRSQPSSIAR